MKKLLLPILLLSACGCDQHPELTPLPESVAPAVVAQGQERYVVIAGENFTPALSWKSAGGAGVDATFLVQFGNQPGVGAWPASTESLTARLPKNLPAGRHSVVVQGPGGQAGQLADALCVDDQPFQELIHACLMDITAGVMDICSTSLDGGYHKKPVVSNAVPGIAQGAGTNQTESLWNGFTLSPDGQLLAFLRFTPDQTRLRLILYQFGSGTEITLDEVEVPDQAENPFRLLSPPVFSPDSRLLVYVKNNRRLMRREVPDKIGPLDDPVLLAEEPEQPGAQVNIVYPDIDPAMRFVLYTRVIDSKALERSDDIVSLHLVPLSGGIPRMLLEEDPLSSKNGPGTFLPGGEGVVFISDRLNLQIPTPFGAMTAATNLYRVSLYGGPVEPLGNPTAAYLYGKPAVSPDGRFVATTGFLADVSGSGLDIMLTNLQNGQVTRVLEDPVRYCIPDAIEESCADPVNPREWVLPCCADPGNSATCCGIFGSTYCPTWDVGPSFTPDSRALYANALAISWVCSEDNTYGNWYWQGRIANVFLYKATFNDNGQTTLLETLPYGLLDMPLGPLVRQTVSCP
jgi:hypothetical protein